MIITLRHTDPLESWLGKCVIYIHEFKGIPTSLPETLIENAPQTRTTTQEALIRRVFRIMKATHLCPPGFNRREAGKMFYIIDEYSFIDRKCSTTNT